MLADGHSLIWFDELAVDGVGPILTVGFSSKVEGCEARVGEKTFGSKRVLGRQGGEEFKWNKR